MTELEGTVREERINIDEAKPLPVDRSFPKDIYGENKDIYNSGLHTFLTWFFIIAVVVLLSLGMGFLYLINKEKLKSTIDQPITILNEMNQTINPTFNNPITNDIKLAPIITIHLNQTINIDRVIINSS